MNHTAPSHSVSEITASTFNSEVVENKTPILIDFWAPWCGPCRMMKPILGEVAKTLSGEVRIAQINVDEEPGIAEAFGIRGIPTLVLIEDGKVVDSVSGVVPADKLVSRTRSRIGKGGSVG